MNNFCTAVLSVALFSLLFESHPANAEDDGDKKLIIEAQPLASALREFSQQTGIQVGYASELADGIETQRVEGIEAPDVALETLLASSGLDYRFVNDDTVVIQAAAASGPNEGSSHSGNSRSTLSSVRIAQAQTSMNPAQTSRRTEASSENEERKRPLEEIIVTGTNIRGAINLTVPLTQYDRNYIEYTGARTLQDFLNTIPQNFSGNSSLFSGRAANPFISVINNNGGTGVDLRGLGAGATLTLLNGRRIPASATGQFVDVSTLPLAIIDRVDIQTDGASAIYGSDAIGGVVNFVTRRDFRGFEISGSAATVTDGGKRDYQADATGGIGWSSGGGTLSVSYTDTGRLLLDERDYIGQSVRGTLPGGDIYPDESLWSAYASVQQDIGERTFVSVDAIYSSRQYDSVTSHFGRVQELISGTNNYFVSTQISMDLTDEWNLGLFADYGFNVLEEEANRLLDTGQSFDPFIFENEVLTFEGRTSGELLQLAGGPLSVAFGASYREEGYRDANPPGTPFDPDISRDVTAVYGEFLIPVIGGSSALPMVRRLEFSAAVRYEDYSDFGETFNPRFGVFWELVEGFALRSSYSQSFRAPPLYNVGNSASLGIRGIPDPFYTGTQDPRLPPGTVYAAAIFGNKNLDGLTEETADSFTLGASIDPPSLPQLTLDLSYFDISYEDRIQFINPFNAPGNPAFELFIDRSPDPAQMQTLIDRAMADDDLEFFPFIFDIDGNPLPVVAEDIQVFFDTGTRNLAIVDIRGMDLSTQYTIDSATGQLVFSFNGSYLFDYKVAASPEVAPADVVDQIYRPVDLNLRASGSWSRDMLTVFAAVNYADSYADTLTDPENPIGIDSWTTVDLTLAYGGRDLPGDSLFDRLRLSLTVQNLLDQDPPFVATSDGLNFDYANATPLGRFVSFGFTKTF